MELPLATQHLTWRPGGLDRMAPVPQLVCFSSWARDDSVTPQGLRATSLSSLSVPLYVYSLNPHPPHLQSSSEEQWLRTQTSEADYVV